ncbi:MAG: hypothetical protein LBV72_06210 [Tannerella sp.]|nr:hypothetical protein [Tannerella sp.]
MNKVSKTQAIIFFLMFCAVISLKAQETSTTAHGALDAEALKKANDPMAHTKAFNLHNYIITNIYGAPDYGANQLMFRYAQPVGKFLLRGTMPVMTSSGPGVGPKSGLGDFNLFAIYAIEKKGNKFGVGPLLTAPTGTNGFSSDKWQAGVAAMAFFASNPTLQTGALLQWQTDFAGSSNAADIDLLTAQLFGMWQIGGGTYLRSTGIWSFDLTNGNYSVPIGLGIGRVIKVGGVVFNIFAEPQFSVLAEGEGQSRFQVFVGFNTQF